VPLNKTGEDKTYHLADDALFAKLSNKKLIINASRGPVVETLSLKKALQEKIVDACVLDVWENEPNIDRELLELVDIATPHIAGYSADGKANGTSMCIAQLRTFFNLPMPADWYPDAIPPSLQQREITLDCGNKTKQEILSEVVIASYDIMSDDKILRNSVETFEQQRGAYPIRREFPFYAVKILNADKEIIDTISQLGFKIKH
jgi:erythronate-4-phosphate dehydrogenase